MSEKYEFHVTDDKDTQVHLVLSKKLKAEEIAFYQKLINDHINYWLKNLQTNSQEEMQNK